jgi:hypothetical protein
MTYKFEQFNVEILNPTIFVNLNTIQDKAIDQLLSVSLTLSTDSATFGLTALDMPYLDTWEDNEVEGMVLNWLRQFEV